MSKNKIPDQVGKRYNKLTIIKRVDDKPYGNQGRVRAMFLCRCDCGVIKEIDWDSLKRGATVSCGCHKNKISGDRFKTHELSNTPEYISWKNMKARCYNKSNTSYKNYGGRGITVCDSWLNSFENFYRDMGEKPSPELSLERRDVNGNYERSNCYWATNTVQANNKTNNIYIEFNGVCKTLSEWSLSTGLPYDVLKRRKSRGWSVEDLLTKPVKALKKYTYLNKTLTLHEWAEELKLKYTTLQSRLYRGWPVERAFKSELESTSKKNLLTTPKI